MVTALLVLAVLMVLAALVYGVVAVLSGDDPGLGAAEPDGRALPLPNSRSLTEVDLKTVRFDVALRGYRMAQVDRVLRRTAYDIGYKDEMIAVLEAEVAALREGRREDAELLRKSRESAASPEPPARAAPAATEAEANTDLDEDTAGYEQASTLDGTAPAADASTVAHEPTAASDARTASDAQSAADARTASDEAHHADEPAQRSTRA